MEVKLYAFYRAPNFKGDPPILDIGLTDWRPYKGMENYVLAGEYTVEMEIPPPNHADVILARVKALRVQQGDLQHQADLIEEEIKSLLAIEHQVPEQEDA